MGIHLARVSLFVVILVLIRFQHRQLAARPNDASSAPVEVEQLLTFFPTAESVSAAGSGRGTQNVFNGTGEVLGYVLTTSPDADHIIGFSGPTNCLIAFTETDEIAGVTILSSGDTRDHLKQVIEDGRFLDSFRGLSWQQAAQSTSVDSVSGATLTSLAIRESIVYRLSGGRPSLRFPEPLTVADAKQFFPSAESIIQSGNLWRVSDSSGKELGSLARTSPAADNLIGFQGPTETRIGLDNHQQVIGLQLGRSYDNEPYVSYVRDDLYFRSLFDGQTLEQIAAIDLEDAGIEGVSGATMTSQAVASGVIAAAQNFVDQHENDQANRQASTAGLLGVRIRPRDLGTLAVILAGVIIAFTSLRGRKLVRVGFQLILIGYLGLVNGDMISQAMLVGWAQNGIPWSNAVGLVLLSLAAFAIPITTRRNVYCSHLCPHGAVQQLIKNRLPWKLRLSRRLKRALTLIPVLLLTWCLTVAMTGLGFSLVDIEPFDAWVFRIAGWATISVAVVGLIASLFVPMAYCRYGCPTGALLDFVRFHSRSDVWSGRDWLAVGLTILAAGCWVAT